MRGLRTRNALVSVNARSESIVGDSYIGLIWRSEQRWRHYYREVGALGGGKGGPAHELCPVLEEIAGSKNGKRKR